MAHTTTATSDDTNKWKFVLIHSVMIEEATKDYFKCIKKAFYFSKQIENVYLNQMLLSRVLQFIIMKKNDTRL